MVKFFVPESADTKFDRYLEYTKLGLEDEYDEQDDTYQRWARGR